jgi:hypothetical protein
MQVAVVVPEEPEIRGQPLETVVLVYRCPQHLEILHLPSALLDLEVDLIGLQAVAAEEEILQQVKAVDREDLMQVRVMAPLVILLQQLLLLFKTQVLVAVE